MKKPKDKPFKLESDLCAAFIAALPNTWKAYPETAGWDILLVRKADGCQVGIQAKLKLNAEVLTQAIDRSSYHSGIMGPDYRAVLVPPGEAGWGSICAYIGVTVMTLVEARFLYPREDGPWSVSPKLPILPADDRYYHREEWFEWVPTKRHELPDYVPDVVAGSAAPVQLTKWKIKAIKLAILIQRRGYALRTDFKHLDLDSRRWMPSANGWLIPDKSIAGYQPSPHFPDFKAQHPTNWEQIAADFDKWAPPEPILKLQQESMPV